MFIGGIKNKKKGDKEEAKAAERQLEKKQISKAVKIFRNERQQNTGQRFFAQKIKK